jgi:hypothetical protein
MEDSSGFSRTSKAVFPIARAAAGVHHGDDLNTLFFHVVNHHVRKFIGFDPAAVFFKAAWHPRVG